MTDDYPGLAAGLKLLYQKRREVAAQKERVLKGSGLETRLFDLEVAMGKVRNDIVVIGLPFEQELERIDLEISDVKGRVRLLWFAGGDSTLNFITRDGVIRLKKRTSVVINDNSALLALLVDKLPASSVGSYVTSFKKSNVRKFIGVFDVDPEVAQIMVKYDVDLEVAGDD